MTKKFRFLALTVIILLAITTFIIINPILGKFLTGTARIIGKETVSQVYIDGVLKSKARIYSVKSNFEGNESRDYLILYLKQLDSTTAFPVLIIDRENNSLAFPNASDKDYQIVLGNLFQSDSGANVMVRFKDDVKGLGFEPDLKIKSKTITFNIPFKNKIQSVKINVV